MFTCSASKSKGTVNPVPCRLPAPVKKIPSPKEPTAKKPAVQVGHPASDLKSVTEGKRQSKTVLKNNTIVFGDDKIQAKPKPSNKESAAKKEKARKFIGDFGMIKMAKDSNKAMKPSIWGNPSFPVRPALPKQGKAQH